MCASPWAEFFIDMDEPRLGERFLRDAVVEKPGAASPRSALARALFLSGDLAGGELEAESALTLNGSCSEAHALLGQLCLERGIARSGAHPFSEIPGDGFRNSHRPGLSTQTRRNRIDARVSRGGLHNNRTISRISPSATCGMVADTIAQQRQSPTVRGFTSNIALSVFSEEVSMRPYRSRSQRQFRQRSMILTFCECSYTRQMTMLPMKFSHEYNPKARTLRESTCKAFFDSLSRMAGCRYPPENLSDFYDCLQPPKSQRNTR